MFLAILILLAAAPGTAQTLTGEWDMEAQSNSGPRRFVLKLEQTGNVVSGSIREGAVTLSLAESRFSENQLRLRVSYEDRPYELKAALKGETLEGSWESGNSSGSWKATRKKADALSGLWKCRAPTGDTADATFTLDLKQAGPDITGSAASPRGSVPISKGSFKGNSLELAIPTDDGAYILTGSLEQGKLRGEWRRWDNRKGTWEGEKQ